jgi:four helix bundle protein
MAGIKRFEELEVWKLARELTNLIYRATASGEFSRDFGLKDQIRRSAVSILSNIAEGFERGGDKEFIQFLAIAKGSCGETRAQLYVALDQKYITETQFAKLVDIATKTSRMLSGLIGYLKRSELRGTKYK